jgi:F0F1-type ATP synthase epsilon subunit
MAASTVRFVVRTPHEVVFDADVRSVRVLTDTGHVGVRPRMESLVLPVEAGLVLVHTRDHVAFIGSAGGLLSSDGALVTLFTPLGVVGTDPAAIRASLDQAFAEPGSEFAVRARLGKLEGRILAELHTQPSQRPLLVGERR